jgi:hypothetical protein
MNWEWDFGVEAYCVPLRSGKLLLWQSNGRWVGRWGSLPMTLQSVTVEEAKEEALLCVRVYLLECLNEVEAVRLHEGIPSNDSLEEGTG